VNPHSQRGIVHYEPPDLNPTVVIRTQRPQHLITTQIRPSRDQQSWFNYAEGASLTQSEPQIQRSNGPEPSFPRSNHIPMSRIQRTSRYPPFIQYPAPDPTIAEASSSTQPELHNQPQRTAAGSPEPPNLANPSARLKFARLPRDWRLPELNSPSNFGWPRV
jgi:hypothetical protein